MCIRDSKDAGALAEKGYLTLSVNPEIMITYDKKGLVTDLTGKNDDGKKIAADYDDYIGKECDCLLYTSCGWNQIIVQTF